MPPLLLHSHSHRLLLLLPSPPSLLLHYNFNLISTPAFTYSSPFLLLLLQLQLQLQRGSGSGGPKQCLSISSSTSTSTSTSEESNNNNIKKKKKKKETLLSLIRESCSKKTHLLQSHAHLLRTSLLDDPTILPLCNTILKGYSNSSTPEKAFSFYALMRLQGFRPNPFTSSFLVKSCTRVASLVGGRQMHACILLGGHQSDCLLLTSLVELYSVCGEGDDGCQLFDEMSHRDTVAWNVLISCYARNRRTRDALRLFDEMQAPPHGSEPDDVTCLLLLQACAQLGALDFGKRIHHYIEERGYGRALNLCNSLVAMYSRCGCVDEAFRVFDGVPEKNVVTWSAMISGFAMNGHGREALDAFGEMRRMGVPPDDQTFTGVLSACSHGGLVDEGLRLFDMMTAEFALVPNIHHYGCMIDLLGRAGLLDRAYHLINSMVVEPDATIWRTLLGACRIHGHVALGERVVGHLIELKAQQAGDYILLLNIYASVGDWEKVAVVRRLMKDKRIQTTPGCSTIELKGVVHEFVVDDDSHPMKEDIYAKLDEIGRQLKIAGYIADMTAELHDLDTEGKENALSYHSEKLAIAFGMVATPPGTTIRVAKNLRICVDCHTFAKILSSVYNRDVVIRDRSRFHHFREGFCSCNDYW